MYDRGENGVPKREFLEIAAMFDKLRVEIDDVPLLESGKNGLDLLLDPQSKAVEV